MTRTGLKVALISTLRVGGRRARQTISGSIGASWVRVALVASLLILAGCDGLGTGVTNPSTATATETPRVATPTLTPTATPTATPTPDPQEWSQERKYEWFAQEYYEQTNAKINAQNASVKNGTLHYTFELRNPNNKSRLRYEQAVILTYYASLAEGRMGDKQVNEEWVPKRLAVTEMAPNGKVYRKSHTNYTNAMRYTSEDGDYVKYYFAYINAGEHGPAYEEYNG